MLVPEYWRFIAEGSAHLVYRYVGPPSDYFSGMVLKLPKDTSPKNEDRLLHQHKFVQKIVVGRHVSPSQSPLFYPNDVPILLDKDGFRSSSSMHEVADADVNSLRDALDPLSSVDSYCETFRLPQCASSTESSTPSLLVRRNSAPCFGSKKSFNAKTLPLRSMSPSENVSRVSTHTGSLSHSSVASFFSWCDSSVQSESLQGFAALSSSVESYEGRAGLRLSSFKRTYTTENSLKLFLQDRGLVGRIHIPLQQLHLFENRHTVKLREQVATERSETTRATMKTTTLSPNTESVRGSVHEERDSYGYNDCYTPRSSRLLHCNSLEKCSSPLSPLSQRHSKPCVQDTRTLRCAQSTSFTRSTSRSSFCVEAVDSDERAFSRGFYPDVSCFSRLPRRRSTYSLPSSSSAQLTPSQIPALCTCAERQSTDTSDGAAKCLDLAVCPGKVNSAPTLSTAAWFPSLKIPVNEDMRSSFALLEKDLVTPPMPFQNLLSVAASTAASPTPTPDGISPPDTTLLCEYFTCELKPKAGLPALVRSCSPDTCFCKSESTVTSSTETFLPKSMDNCFLLNSLLQQQKKIRCPSRFTLQQQLKLQKNEVCKVSCYKPELFFSHLRDRDVVREQLRALLKQPQNNCRLFVDGIRVLWSDGQRMKQEMRNEHSMSHEAFDHPLSLMPLPLLPPWKNHLTARNLLNDSAERLHLGFEEGLYRDKYGCDVCPFSGNPSFVPSNDASYAPIYFSASGPASFLFGCENFQFCSEKSNNRLSQAGLFRKPNLPLSLPCLHTALNQEIVSNENLPQDVFHDAFSPGHYGKDDAHKPASFDDNSLKCFPTNVRQLPTEMDLGSEDVFTRHALGPIFELFGEVVLKEVDLFHRLLYVHALCEGQQQLAQDLLNGLIDNDWIESCVLPEDKTRTSSTVDSVAGTEEVRRCTCAAETLFSMLSNTKSNERSTTYNLMPEDAGVENVGSTSFCQSLKKKVADPATINLCLMSDTYAIPALEEFLKDLQVQAAQVENEIRTGNGETSTIPIDREAILAERIQLWHYQRGRQLLSLMERYIEAPSDNSIDPYALRTSIIYWIYRFLVGRTFLDCSVMLNLALSVGEPLDHKTVLESRFIKLCEIPLAAFSTSQDSATLAAPAASSAYDVIRSALEQLRVPVFASSPCTDLNTEQHNRTHFFSQKRISSSATDVQWLKFIELVHESRLAAAPTNVDDISTASSAPVVSIWYRVSVVDLDLKQASKIPRWAKQLEAILQAQGVKTLI